MDAWTSAVDPKCAPTVEVEMRVRRASDGNYRWTLCHVSPSFDSQNRAEMVREKMIGNKTFSNALVSCWLPGWIYRI
jgi:hypothetical protein